MTAVELPALREPLKVKFNARRPWPLGVPSKEEALAAIISHGEIDAELEGSHLRALTLFPEWVFDEARTALVSAGTELAWASASAWRAVVALERIDGAVSIDAAGLAALSEEVAKARERIVGYSAFALDGGAGSTELLSTLDECIGRFARVEEQPKTPPPVSLPSRVVPSPSRVMRKPPPVPVASAETKNNRKLFALGAALLAVLALLYFIAPTSGPRASVHEEWVVQGSIDSGNAKLVPDNPQASEAALQRKLSELKHQGIAARLVNDEWVLEREAPSAP